MGIIPLQFQEGQNADNLGLNGTETFSLKLKEGKIKIGELIDVTTSTGKKFKVKARLDTEPEIQYFQEGGILHYVLRKLLK